MGKRDSTGGETWKVGELARLAGLTVRTLHHYDRIGLLRPSNRTPSGHRLYNEADVSQLHRILTLRKLGLPLPDIAELLHGEPNLASLLRSHLGHVNKQIRALRSLRTRLAGLLSAAESAGQLPSAALLNLMGEVMTAQEKIKTYFSDAQLAQRREQIGEKAIANVQAE
ncbi:MAG: MerR family transcriptional regulator [Mycobacteriales bacterium]